MRKIVITGGAGFIGSNLCDFFIAKGDQVVCLDNFSTGYRHNIAHLLSNPNFTLVEGDIRNLDVCKQALQDATHVLHQAALGSVPRSIIDPITTNEVNISGFLNMLVATRDAGIKRFVYAASSSTYGDLETLPKVEHQIGKPLSPYAITKYVNELYAENFSKLYGLETIGLRYFNVFGKKQDPNSVYAAVIPKFVQQLIHKQAPVINGDGTFSRDFTYIDNVLQMNELALSVKNEEALNTVYNTAYGENTSLNTMVTVLKELLVQFDPTIQEVEISYGPERIGDIPHSLASIDKAKKLLNYNPQYSFVAGIKEAVQWYWENLKDK